MSKLLVGLPCSHGGIADGAAVFVQGAVGQDQEQVFPGGCCPAAFGAEQVGCLQVLELIGLRRLGIGMRRLKGIHRRWALRPVFKRL